MHTEKTSFTRRALLRLASLLPVVVPVAFVARRARADHHEAAGAEKPAAPCTPSDPTKYAEARRKIWAGFNAGKGTTPLAAGLEQKLETERGEILCRKWDVYEKHPDGTVSCARLAGSVAEHLRVQEGKKQEIDEALMDASIAAVALLYSRRKKDFTGALC